MNHVAATLASLALVACASSVDPSPATVRKERIASWETQCEARGFVRGTADFKDCLSGYEKQAGAPPP
ncbi:MAG: hypothetical protein U1F41_00655 [Burkholderiales bacterium]